MISVIIPTYKPDEYIWECFNSLEKQLLSKDKFEVIVILNGCEEPYKTKIESYIKKSNLNFNFIHTNIPGVSHARNLGLDKACGDYITFIDDDDYISESYLKELYEKATPEIISLSNTYDFYDNDQNRKLHDCYLTNTFNKRFHLGKTRFNYKIRRYFGTPCRKLIHKDIINTRRFNTKFKNGEDTLFMLMISDKITFIDFTSPDAIYYRRLRTNSATTSPKSITYHIKNSFKSIYFFSITWIKKPFNYNFMFFTSRVVGTLYSLAKEILKRKFR